MLHEETPNLLILQISENKERRGQFNLLRTRANSARTRLPMTDRRPQPRPRARPHASKRSATVAKENLFPRLLRLPSASVPDLSLNVSFILGFLIPSIRLLHRSPTPQLLPGPYPTANPNATGRAQLSTHLFPPIRQRGVVLRRMEYIS